MTDNDFDTQRTELANRFASAGAEFLGQMPLAAAALAAIPNTQPQQYAMVGEPKAIRALLPDDMPARRMRHGQRPTKPLEWEPPAIANKATEEGELHHRLDATAIRSASFAADRASRQVVNKAEVEPSDSYKSGYADGMEEGAKLAFWDDKPSEKFPEGWPAEIWLNAGDDELGPFSEYDEVSWCSAPQGESDIRYIREDLLATPPATTGASTVLTDEPGPLNTLIQIAEFLDSSSNQQQTGVDSWDYASQFDYELGHAASEIRSIVADISSQVAAQAGQVAVPGGHAVVPIKPSLSMIAATVDTVFDGAIEDASVIEEIYAAMIAAAPSPAKESK